VLGFRHAVHGVVIRLAHDRAVDADLVTKPANLRDSPGAKIRDAEVPHLPLADQIGNGMHGFGKRRLMILLVEVIDVDAIDAEATQARFRRAHHPMA
jgi:hypothetical protein